MLDLSVSKVLVLLVVALIVLGPDRLPAIGRDAARMIRTLREIATGARTQLREELGPEFADMDLRGLNPRVAISRAILGEDAGMGLGLDRASLKNALLGADEPQVSLGKSTPAAAPAAAQAPSSGPVAAFDPDAT
jgi:sec-independent protein translocase protein TatB